MEQKTIPIERLRSLVSYNPVDGTFITPKGKITKGGKGKRCMVIWIEGKRYPCHRVAWALMTGEWPVDLIDHEDTDFTNNVWTNLREATQLQNMANIKKSVANTSGFKGVHWAKNVGKWRARIRHEGKFLHLGLFDKRELGHAAYVEAAIRLKGEFARAA